MRSILFALLLVLQLKGYSQSATEIWLFDLNLKGTPTVTGGKNFTNHPGYDNQPFFRPGHHEVLYASFREDGRADLKKYNWKSGATADVTRTPEREYSPTITPDKKWISCIIQRDNGAQDLGKYPIQGGQADVLITNLTVGYHAWLSKTDLILFVLGNPQTLRHYNILTRKDTVLLEKPGRSIQRIPGTKAISFVDKSDPLHWFIWKVEADLKPKKVTETIHGSEDIAWTPDGRIISSDGTRFLICDPSKTNGWIPMEGPKMNGISRISISADGKKLAAVIAE